MLHRGIPYQITDEWRLGANLLVQSGRPLNCFGAPYENDDGTVGPNHWPEPGYAGYAFYCGGKLVPRGTNGRLEWNSNLSLNLSYEPRWMQGLRLSADVFNVFNDRSILSVNRRPFSFRFAAMQHRGRPPDAPGEGPGGGCKGLAGGLLRICFVFYSRPVMPSLALTYMYISRSFVPMGVYKNGF